MLVQVNSGYVRLCQVVRLSHFNSGLDRLDEVSSCFSHKKYQVRLSQVISGYERLDQVRSC